MPYQVTITPGFDAIDRLADVWSGLLERIERPSLQHTLEYSRACARRWRRIRGAELLVLVVRDAARTPVLAGAFVRQREWLFFHRLTLLHARAPYGTDILVDRAVADDADLWRAFWEALDTQAGARRLRIDWLHRDRPLANAILSRRHASAPHSAALRVDLTPFWGSDFLEMKGAQLRQDHKRRLRRMADRGAVRFHRVQPAEIDAALDWLFAVKYDWARRTGLKRGWIWDPQTRVVTAELAHAFAALGKLRFEQLLIGDRIAASTLSMDIAGTTLFLMTGYDPEFSQYSPGFVSCTELAQTLVADRQSMLDLMTGDLPWKRRLASERVPVGHFRIPLGKRRRS